ncbi:MAG: hypothetical protein ACOCUT_02035 [bacterium]
MSNQVEYGGGKLKVNIENEGEQGKLFFEGVIDEDFSGDKISSVKFKNYLIDFDKVSMINSCGIREWITYLETIDSQSKITYVNCPPVIVNQMNIVAGFLTPNAKVESFYAPYYDEEEDEEIIKLLKVEDIKDGKAPVLTNDNGEELEFDGIEKQYFNFINLQKK